MDFSDDDFDDDFDDILQSDDDIPKKPKVVPVMKNPSDEKKHEYNAPITTITSLPKNDHTIISKNLFRDEIDDLILSDSTKSKETPNKPAKSVLESLLNPSKELDEMNFSFATFNSQSSLNSNSKPDLAENRSLDFLAKHDNRPVTANPKQKDHTPNTMNKRSVHFSNETLLDDKIDFESSLNKGRPQTAPNTAESAKPKFLSRFEAAELEDIPIKINDNIKLTSASESSLWVDSKSDDFVNVSGNDFKMKTETVKNKAPKQLLSEFMQSSQEDILNLSVDKPRSSIFNELSSRRRSSNDNLLESRPRTSLNISDDMNVGRRTSLPKDEFIDRPKTAHHRIKAGGSQSSDILFEDNTDYQMKLKNLESERDELLYKLEQVAIRNKEELELKEKSYKNRIEIIEENMLSKEKRLREEIDLLSEQNKQKLQMIEQERMEMRSELTRRQDEMESQKRQELARVKDQHRLELEKMRLNYEDLIDKVNKAKLEESETIRMAQPTTMQLQSVLAQVSTGAQDLVSMKQQLMDQFNHQIREKDIQLKEKNDYLRQLEEKLDIQKDENARERERLQNLISKLDIQLKEQTRIAEEERWFLRQEQNKLVALQTSLEKEREQLLIEKDHNRASHEESRKRILEEQKQMLDQIYEEKRNLAEERAKLTREMFRWSETNQLSSVKKNQETAELDGMRAALIDERRDLERMKTQLVNEREEFLLKSSKLESSSHEVRMKTEKLVLLEKELNTKQILVNEKEQQCREMEIRGENALRKAKELHSSHDDQLSKIQKQLDHLNQTEQKVNKELIELEKRRLDVVSKEKSVLCSKCSGSLKNSTFGGSYNSLNRLPNNGFTRRDNDFPFHNIRSSFTMDQEIRNSLEYSNFIASHLEEERLMQSIKLAADNDREFLNQERAYLKSLSNSSLPLWKTHIRS